MAQIMVYPTSRNALVMKHPISGPLNIGGSLWEEDGVTMRALTDGSLTTIKAAGFRDQSEAIDITKPPPHATAIPDNPPEVKVTTREDDPPPLTKTAADPGSSKPKT